MRNITRHIKLTVKAFDELQADEAKIIEPLTQALDTAYAPYSNFPVSAVLALQDGTLLTGSNQENAAYPSGLCAERVVLFNKGATLPKEPIKILAVAVKKNLDGFPYPCGGCLQVISEFQQRQKEPFQIMLCHLQNKEVLIASSIEQLMPFAFNKKHLI